MPIFKCWKPDYGHVEADDAKSVDAFDDKQAAELYAERRFGQDDYPQEQIVSVRSSDGTLATYEVEVRQEPVFVAARTEWPRPGPVAPVPVAERVCRGCGASFPITCMTGELAGYWHLSCLLDARKKLTDKATG